VNRAPTPRQLSCARCGASFACTLGGDCWCAAEPVRLPVIEAAEDCLCRDCLRKAAGQRPLPSP
jgi:hypothetical protein